MVCCLCLCVQNYCNATYSVYVYYVLLIVGVCVCVCVYVRCYSEFGVIILYKIQDKFHLCGIYPTLTLVVVTISLLNQLYMRQIQKEALCLLLNPTSSGLSSED